jgi:hypothetical protein
MGRKLKRPPAMRRIPTGMRIQRDEGLLSNRKKPEADSGSPSSSRSN